MSSTHGKVFVSVKGILPFLKGILKRGCFGICTDAVLAVLPPQWALHRGLLHTGIYDIYSSKLKWRNIAEGERMGTSRGLYILVWTASEDRLTLGRWCWVFTSHKVNQEQPSCAWMSHLHPPTFKLCLFSLKFTCEAERWTPGSHKL